MKKIILLTFTGVLLTMLAMSQDMKTLPSGASYKIISKGGGPQVKLNDVITFQYIQKTAKDSVLGRSLSAEPVKIPVTASQNIGDLMDIFVLLNEKDSVLVYVPTDSIFKGREAQRPPFFPVGSPVIFNIKIVKVQSMEDAKAEYQKQLDSIKAAEKTTLTAYLSSTKLVYATTPSGILYGITSPSAKLKPMKGDTVFVNYVGSTLDGKVFDTSIQAEAIKAGLDQPGRPYEPIKLAVGTGEVIPGWDEGLLLFGEGAKGFLIIPSELAYGERGGGAIKPFSTLRFEIEMVKIKKPVKVIPKPLVKKKPVAPATTKKPVAKPVAKPVVKKAGVAPVKKK